MFNLHPLFLVPVIVSARSNTRLGRAVDVIRRAMQEDNCKLYRGFIFKHVPESQRTFIFYKSVKDYLLRIIKDISIADILAGGVFWEAVRILQEPACRLLPQMKIDFNYIEVSDGHFFNIEKKKFESDIEIDGSPRAFVIYDCKRKPNPVPFIEGEPFKCLDPSKLRFKLFPSQEGFTEIIVKHHVINHFLVYFRNREQFPTCVD